MNNFTLIGIVGRDAEVAYFKPVAAAAVTTFWIATTNVRPSSGPHTDLTTWHKISAYGRLQQVAATIHKGDLVAVSGPIHTRATAAHDRQAQSHILHATAVEVLQRNDTPSGNQPAEF